MARTFRLNKTILSTKTSILTRRIYSLSHQFSSETKYVDLQDDKELTVTEYLSEDLQKNWGRVWNTTAYNTQGRFHENDAYTAAKKHLWYTGWVTLCGYPGDGRSCSAEHLVCNFVRGPWEYPTRDDSRWTYEHGRRGEWERKKYFTRSIAEKERERYTPVFVNSPAEFKAELNPKEHQIFVIDDIFGEACLNLTLVEQWRPHLEDIMMELTANLPKTLVIICVNKAHLDKLPELSRLDWFKPGIMIDFTSTHNLDESDRREQIVRNGVPEKTWKSEMEKMGFFEVKEGAGLVYRIYNQIKSFKMEGPAFFRNPWKFIQDSIDKIYRFDKIFYYTIAVATLLDGKLDLSKKAVTDYDQRSQDVIRELIPLLGVPEHVNLSKMRFAAQQLTGFFFQPIDQFKWVITHPKIYHLCVRSLYSRSINKHIVRLASPHLLMNYIRTIICSEGQHELAIKVGRESYEELAKKYINEITSGKMKACIQSPCFGDADFVKVWFQQVTAFGMKASILEPKDPILERNLFYWACYYGHGYVVQAFLQSDPTRSRDEDWFWAETKGYYAACASNSPTANIAVQCLLQQDAISTSICEVYEESTYGKVFPEELCYLMFLEAPSIHVAARFGHPDIVKLLLQKTASHSEETKDGLTPLHRAASRLDSAGELITEILIRQGASIDVKTPKGRKPIHEAVACGNSRVVAALVTAGENVNGKMEDGQSFLAVAIQGQHKELTDYLILKEVDINGCPEDNFTPLQHAIRTGNTDLADRLINGKDVDLNKKGKAGMGALHAAVLHRDEQIVDKLIAKGADVNLQGTGNITPLHMAAKHGLYTMVNKLMGTAMAKPEMMTTNKETAVVLAAREGHKYVVWLLLQEGMELEGGVTDMLFFGGMIGGGIRGPLMERDYFRMFHK